MEFMLFCRFDCFELGFFAGHYVVRLLSVLACSSPPPPCGVALHHVMGPLLCGLSLVLSAIPLQVDAWLLSGPLLRALLLCTVCTCAPVSLSSTLSIVTLPGEDSRGHGAFRCTRRCPAAFQNGCIRQHQQPGGDPHRTCKHSESPAPWARTASCMWFHFVYMVVNEVEALFMYFLVLCVSFSFCLSLSLSFFGILFKYFSIFLLGGFVLTCFQEFFVYS